jgi:hypothetical protein
MTFAYVKLYQGKSIGLHQGLQTICLLKAHHLLPPKPNNSSRSCLSLTDIAMEHTPASRSRECDQFWHINWVLIKIRRFQLVSHKLTLPPALEVICQGFILIPMLGKTIIHRWQLREHLRWFSLCDPAKLFHTSKFRYLLFSNPTHQTKTGTAHRWETTNNNPPGPIKLSSQSTTGVRLCGVPARLRCAFYLSELCKNAGPKPFSWAWGTCLDFPSSHFYFAGPSEVSLTSNWCNQTLNPSTEEEYIV